jgi:hypothetical protein
MNGRHDLELRNNNLQLIKYMYEALNQHIKAVSVNVYSY